MDERDAAVAQLRQVLGALDRERDELATDADAKAEEVQRLALSTEKALQAAADLLTLTLTLALILALTLTLTLTLALTLALVLTLTLTLTLTRRRPTSRRSWRRRASRRRSWGSCSRRRTRR